jgi:hypothetical protein
MVRQIHLKELIPFDDKRLGERPKREDVSEIIDEDCNVYGPEGNLVLAFRKGYFDGKYGITPGSDAYNYWRWACRSLLSDQRGLASGKEIYTNVEIRVTHGQNEFMRRALKGLVSDLKEALEIINADSRPSRTTYYVGKAEKAGLVDLKEIERWDSLVRKKSTTFEARQEAIAKRNKAKLAWFENWLRRDWATSDDKVKAAKDCKKTFFTSQPRSNKTYSAVLGTIDRSGRTPFGRLTAPTMERYEDFESFKEFYKEVDSFVGEYFPTEYSLLQERFRNVKDERYNLFGTIYTSITTNFCFPTFYHFDGSNAKNAVATLVTFDQGNYEGMEFLLPQLGLGFKTRMGDVLTADNQNFAHGQTEFVPLEDGAENLTLVYYSRDSVITLDSLECETCRREFLSYVVENHPELGTGEEKWAGSAPGLWGSKYWEDYKALRSKDGEYDYTQCSNTDIKGNLDKGQVEIRQPHLLKR